MSYTVKFDDTANSAYAGTFSIAGNNVLFDMLMCTSDLLSLEGKDRD